MAKSPDHIPGVDSTLSPRTIHHTIDTPEALSNHRIFKDMLILEGNLNETQMDFDMRNFHTRRVVSIFNREAEKAGLIGETVTLTGLEIRIPATVQAEGFEDGLLTTVPLKDSLTDGQRFMMEQGLFTPSITGELEGFFATTHAVDPVTQLAKSALHFRVKYGTAARFPFLADAPTLLAHAPVLGTDIEFAIDREVHMRDRALETLYSQLGSEDMRKVVYLDAMLTHVPDDEVEEKTLEEINVCTTELCNSRYVRNNHQVRDALLALLKSRFHHPGIVHQVEADCLIRRHGNEYVIHVPPGPSFVVKANIEDVVFMTESNDLADGKVSDRYAPYFAVSVLNGNEQVDSDEVIYLPLKYICALRRVDD